MVETFAITSAKPNTASPESEILIHIRNSADNVTKGYRAHSLV
jgi:hypothetical protein